VVQDVLEQLHALNGDAGLQGLGQLLEAALEGIVVCDADGQIRAANDPACQMLGASRLQLEGHPMPGADCTAVDEAGNALSRHDSPVMQSIATGGAVRAVMGVVRSGSDVVWLRTNASPLRNESGAIKAVILSLIDITPRKRAEAALRASESHSRVLAQAVAQSNAAMVITDLNGSLEYVTTACCRAYG
jgi:two-component system CheB/CheR fusion protein